MSVNKSPSIQTYRLLLYQRALHPELFGITQRRTTNHGQYEVETWLIPGGHIVRFQLGNQCLTEAVIDHDQQLPQRGLLQALPCLGEKEMDEIVEKQIRYVASVQTELLSDNLFSATYQEMKDFAAETQALSYEWADPEGGTNLSVLDIQKYKREIHVQSYHLIGSAGFVLRTQSIFEVA